MERYEINIIGSKDKCESQLLIEVDEAETSENITIKAMVNGTEIAAVNYNYLSAFREFQDKLLRLRYGMKCNGARINAVQSPMMGATERVYLVEMGRKASMSDVVSMWDYAEINNFIDSKEQSRFFEQWSGSWVKSIVQNTEHR